MPNAPASESPPAFDQPDDSSTLGPAPAEVDMAKQPESAEPVLLLDEFCRRLSTQFRMTELIAAFHADELQQGHRVATQTEFNQRLAQYRARPVTE